MKTKLLSILAALSLMLGVGLVVAPGANAAAVFNCRTYQDWYNPSNSNAWVKVCSVVNGTAVQGYIEMGPASPNRIVNLTYYSLGATFYEVTVPASPAGPTYGATRRLSSGVNFQVGVRDNHGIYWAPTVSIP